MTKCCCCCPSDEGSQNDRSRELLTTETTARMGSGLLSLDGIVPNVIHLIAPQTLERNNAYEDEWVGSSKQRGYPPDPSYPSDSRSRCEALTPVYRGGQNKLLAYMDVQSFHGVNGNNTAGGIYYPWDGVTTKTPFIVDTATEAEKSAHRSDWYNWLFPQTAGSNYVMRGLKELYEATMPFQNENDPTVKEFEDWSLIVLNHFRTLMSLNPVTYDQRLFIKAQLSDERKNTGIWDTYPGTLDSAFGPCIPGTNMHCGATFVPSETDQQPYWNDYNCGYSSVHPHPPFTHASGESEVLGTFWNGNAMTAMSRVIRNLVNGGTTSGHAGAFLFRPVVGYSISGSTSGTIRSKWTGTQQGPPAGFVIA